MQVMRRSRKDWLNHPPHVSLLFLGNSVCIERSTQFNVCLKTNLQVQYSLFALNYEDNTRGMIIMMN